MAKDSFITRERQENGEIVMARYGKIKDMDRSFDIEFWQSQDSAARFRASEELVDYYLRRKGRENERRLQRTVESFQRVKR